MVPFPVSVQRSSITPSSKQPLETRRRHHLPRASQRAGAEKAGERGVACRDRRPFGLGESAPPYSSIHAHSASGLPRAMSALPTSPKIQ